MEVWGLSMDFLYLFSFFLCRGQSKFDGKQSISYSRNFTEDFVMRNPSLVMRLFFATFCLHVPSLCPSSSEHCDVMFPEAKSKRLLTQQGSFRPAARLAPSMPPRVRCKLNPDSKCGACSCLKPLLPNTPLWVSTYGLHGP